MAKQNKKHKTDKYTDEWEDEYADYVDNVNEPKSGYIGHKPMSRKQINKWKKRKK